MCYLIEILPHDVSEMAASRMEHYSAHTVVVLLKLYEVVAASESSCLIVAFLDLRDKLAVGFVASHFSFRPVEDL